MTGHRVACVGLTEISSPSTPRSASLSLICSVYLSRPLCCVCASNPSSPTLPSSPQLLDHFQEEGGQKNKKERMIPFLPGKYIPRLLTNSREMAEKRLPELHRYAK